MGLVVKVQTPSAPEMVVRFSRNETVGRRFMGGITPQHRLRVSALIGFNHLSCLVLTLCVSFRKCAKSGPWLGDPVRSPPADEPDYM